nr:helix-turn-helix domain-containing protein [Streptomyces flavovirens]
MNTGAHTTWETPHMHDEPDRRRSAQSELRSRLDEGRARARLDQTKLARNAGLGRTTVSKALSPRGDVPSVDTVTALAGVLKLPVGELLELRRTAAGEVDVASTDASGPGRPIGQWDPHELEVHPAGPDKGSSGADGVRALSGYARREHDQVLADAVTAAAAGRSGIVVLVGTSSTGKTRALWEAVQPLAEKAWELWHPFDPSRAEAALEDLHRVGPRTVVWLNEAQHYLGDRKFGERIAAAVHQLLLDEERGPVLVLGTLWPEYAHDYLALPDPSRGDPYSLVRELLAGHTVNIPDTFDAAALAAATALAEQGDTLLADVLTRNRNGRITQDLAGAPELLRRYEQPRQAASRALLEAAMDARRLGTGLHLPQAFLTAAAADYLSDHDYDQLTDDWAEQAYAELAEQVHGKQAPLRRTTPRPTRRPPIPTTDASTIKPPPAGPVFRLADYLEQHGRTTRRRLCPPASFWHAAHTHLTHPDDLNHLADAAGDRHRLQWSRYLLQRAGDRGSTKALAHLAQIYEEAGDRDGAEALARQAADHGDGHALYRLADMRKPTTATATPWPAWPGCVRRLGTGTAPRLLPGRPPTTATATPCTAWPTCVTGCVRRLGTGTAPRLLPGRPPTTTTAPPWPAWPTCVRRLGTGTVPRTSTGRPHTTATATPWPAWPTCVRRLGTGPAPRLLPGRPPTTTTATPWPAWP